MPFGDELFDALDLLEFQLDRGRAPEDRDADLDPALLEIQLLHDPIERRKGPIQHLHIVADLIVDADPGLGLGLGGFVLGVEDARGFGVADRLGLAHRAQEAGDLRRVLDEVVDVVGHGELGEDVAGEEFAVRGHFLAAADLGDLFGRDLDRFDEREQAEPRRFGHDLVADLVLEARISVDDVPAGHDFSVYPNLVCTLAEQAEQELDDGAERRVDAEEEDGEQRRHDHDHHRRHQSLPPRRPDDLGRFGPDLPQELAWIDPRHVLASPFLTDLYRKCLRSMRRRLRARRTKVAGVEGFEPTTLGFGDRCSNQTELHSSEPEPPVLSGASLQVQVVGARAGVKRRRGSGSGRASP